MRSSTPRFCCNPYAWIAGQWQWNGYEWIWMSGHYAPDTRYRVWYDVGSYDY